VLSQAELLLVPIVADYPDDRPLDSVRGVGFVADRFDPAEDGLDLQFSRLLLHDDDHL